MLKKYESICESFKNKNHSGLPPYLYLNGNIFWCRFELPKVNGKRRFKRFSLHTTNYYEARQMIIDMERYVEKINQLDRLYRQLKIEKVYAKNNNSIVAYDNILSKDNDVELLKQVKSLYEECYRDDVDQSIESYKFKMQSKITSIILSKATDEQLHNPEYIRNINIALDETGSPMWRKCLTDVHKIKSVLNNVCNIIIQIQDILYPQSTVPSGSFSFPVTPNLAQYPMQVTPPSLTIGKILTNIQETSNNCTEELNREKSCIKELIGVVGLKLEDDYSKLHTTDNIKKIKNYVTGLKIKNDGKRDKIRYIKKIIDYACNESPIYRRDLLNLFTKLPKTPSNEVEHHTPYTQDELIKIFDPQQNFFKNNPDVFWACMIALFCGARTNPATTLQFKDFPIKNGIQCISFNRNHEIKKMKTNATIRIIPLHSKLIDLGLLDYINRHKKKRKAKNEDFIFPNCQTSEGKYNEHFFDRGFYPFLKELGIKKNNTEEEKDHHDFHSFRTNINKALTSVGVDETFRNNIIGWEGSSVNQKNYSTHTLNEIQEQLEKLHYDFLEPAFKEWKKMMANL